MIDETFEIGAGGFTAGEIDVALSLATDGHFVDIATASMALSGISFLKERWNVGLIETVLNAIHSDPLLKAVYDFAKCESLAHEWRKRGADGRDPDAYRDLAIIPLEESARRVDSELKSRATIQHYEVLIANQAAYVFQMEPGKLRDAEQLKLDNLRAELEMVKAQC